MLFCYAVVLNGTPFSDFAELIPYIGFDISFLSPVVFSDVCSWACVAHAAVGGELACVVGDRAPLSYPAVEPMLTSRC